MTPPNKATPSIANGADPTPPAPIERSKNDEEALRDHKIRRRAARPAPPLRLSEDKNGASQLVVDHPDRNDGVELLGAALGCASSESLQGFIDQLVKLFGHGSEPDVKAINLAIKSIAAVAPKDEVEGMLAMQMVATHAMAMNHLKSMGRVDRLHQLEVYERSANKLMRTFAAQMEALRKHRSGGQQKVEVRHVYVNQGGQAIIGAVDAGARPRGGETEET